MFAECVENTTAHGIPQLNQTSNSRFVRVVWLLILLGACGTFFLHSSTLLIKYLNHDTAVSINLDSVNFIPPDVYICNTQALSKALISYAIENEITEYKRIAQHFSKDENINDLHGLMMLGQTTELNSLSYDSVITNRNFEDFINEGLEVLKSKPTRRNQTVKKKYISAADIFRRVPHHERYSCYKLNDKYKYLMFLSYTMKFDLYTDANWIRGPKLNDKRNLAQGDYYTYPEMVFFLMDESPFKIMGSHVVYITPPGEYPHSNSLHFDLGKGKSTTLKITMTYYKSVNKKDRPCRETYATADYVDQIWWNKISYNATPMDCAVRLFQQDSYQQKGCISAALPIPYDLFERKPLYCEFFYNDITELSSQIEYLLMHNERYKECEKYVVCGQPVYSVVTSNNELSADRNKEQLMFWTSEQANKLSKPMNNLMQSEYPEYQNVTVSEPDIYKKSINQVYLHAAKLRSSLYEESFSYELKSLLSDVGGILGFYMGISMVTIMEIIGFAARYCSKEKSKPSDKELEEAEI